MPATLTLDRPRTASLTRTLAVLAPTGLLAIGQLYVGIPLVGALAADWGTTAAAATGAVTSFGLAYAAGLVTFGLLIDRLGPRRVMTYGLLAAAVSTLAVAAAGDLAAGYLLRAVQGFTTAAFAPAAIAYVGANAPAHRLGVALSTLTGGFLAAGAVGQLAGQGVLAVASWRAVFVAGAILFAVAALAVRGVLRPDPVTVRAGGFARPPLSARLGGLYLASFTLVIAFVAIYTALQLGGGMDAELPWLRLSALPAAFAVPFAIGALTWRALVRAGVGLGLVVVSALAIAAGGASTPLLAVCLFALTFGVGFASPSLAEAIGGLSGPARALGAGIFNAALIIGASIAAPMATALNGLSTSALVAAAVTAAGVVAALAAATGRQE